MTQSTAIACICKNPECRLEFSVSGNSKRKYCSHSCYLKDPDKSPNSGQFKKGRISHNKCRVDVICHCGKKFSVVPSRLRKVKRVSCCKQCGFEWLSQRSRTGQIIALYNEGKKAKEIAEILGLKLPSVYSTLNQRKYRFRVLGSSRASATKRFLKGKRCLICGWSRCLDMAHIIPASKGGTMQEENLLALCPNHHRLFDKKHLLPKEAKTLSLRVPNYKEYTDAK